MSQTFNVMEPRLHSLFRFFLPVGVCCVLAACTSARSFLADGVRADRAGDQATALTAYTNAVEHDSTLFDAFYNRGYLYYRTGRYRSALQDLTQALRLQPDDARAWHYRARCHAALQHYDSAVADYSRQIAASPYDASAHTSRAEMYRLQQRYTEALDDYDIALSFDPYMYWAYNGRALAYGAMQRHSESLADADRAVDILYKLMRDLEDMGFNRYWNPQWPPSTPDSVRAAAVQTALAHYRARLVNAYIMRASLHLDQNNPDRAIDEYREALGIDSTSAAAYGNMGWAFYLKGDFERCIVLSEQAVRYNGNALFARYNRALALLRLGRTAEARDAYRETLDYSRFLTEGDDNTLPPSPEDVPDVLSDTVRSSREGAVDDLRSLLRDNIRTEEVRSILREIFHVVE